MTEFGLFNDEAGDWTAEQAVEAGFYSREDAEKALATYDPDDGLVIHEVEEPEDEIDPETCTECGVDIFACECPEEEDTDRPDIADDDVRLDHLPDVDEVRELLARFEAESFWPNVWHVNERGNVDLLSLNAETGEATIVRSWV